MIRMLLSHPRATMLVLGLLYVVGGLALTVLGLVDLKKDPSLTVVIPQLVRCYALLLTGGGWLALLPLLCCRGGQQPYLVILVILLLGGLLQLAINVWELFAIDYWHWSEAVVGAVVAVFECGAKTWGLRKQLPQEERSRPASERL